MAAMVALARGFDVGVAILLDGLIRGEPAAYGQIDGHRLEEGRCLLFRARVRENQPSLVAQDHPAHKTPHKSLGPDVVQTLERVCPAARCRLGQSAVLTATTAPARALTAALAPHHGKQGFCTWRYRSTLPWQTNPSGSLLQWWASH